MTLQALSLITLLVLTGTSAMTAERVNSQPTNRATVQYTPPIAPSRGAPGRRGTGASRGDCVSNKKIPLTALVPSVASQKEENVWGLTTSERPTLLFYTPFAPSCSTIEFALQDDAGTLVYQMPVATPKKPGIISVKLPNAAPVLELNKMYNWSLRVRIKPKQEDDLAVPGELFVVDGWIQRVSPSGKLSQQLKRAPKRRQARLYAENSIWFEALITLAQLRLANGKDKAITNDWKSLLQSVGLEQFAEEPIVLRES